MENGGSNTPTGTNEASTTLAFDPAVQSYYTPAYNDANSTYGTGNMFERPTTQTQGVGDGSFPPQTYGAIETSSVGQPTTNLHPTQLPISNSNPLLFTNYPTAPPPTYPPQHPNQMFSSDQSRAGSLPLTSPHSLDQFLSTPQSHLLQLRGTNPPSQPQTNNFHMYGMPDRPQRFTTFHNLPYSPDPSLKQSAVGQIMDDDSSSGFSTSSSSHNRKKRKACGRCGPCQRKDNCGTCMNCVNRAKGKQICVYRKCEELKKKPGTESYSASTTPDHQVEPVVVRQEKRKELEQLYSERKRSRTEDQSEVATHQNFSGFTSANQNFVQQPNLVSTIPTQQPFNSGPPPSTAHNNPVTLSFQQQLQQNHSPHTSYSQQLQNNGHQPLGNAQQTDIISEALREIEGNPPANASADLNSVLNQGDNSVQNNKVSTNPAFVNPQTNVRPWNPNLPSVETLPSQQQPTSLLQAQLEGTIRLPGQPPPLPPGPGPGQPPPQYQSNLQAGAQADQLLSNLTRFNEYGSFQRNVSSPNQPAQSKRPAAVRRPNYDNTTNQQSQFNATQATGGVEESNSPQAALSTPTSQTIPISQSTNTGNMYHNPASLASYPMTTTVDPHGANPQLTTQLHRPFDSSSITPVQGAPMQMYGSTMPHMSGMRHPNANFQHSPQYMNQNLQMPMQQFPNNIPQQTMGPQHKVSLEQNPLFFQTTGSSGLLPTSQTDSNKYNQGYFQQQMQPKQWNNSVVQGQVSVPASTSANPNSPSVAKQELMSPTTSHSALHSPVSTFSQEAGDHTATISHMPELAPSPIPQASDTSQAVETKKVEETSQSTSSEASAGMSFVSTQSNSSGTMGYTPCTVPQNGGTYPIPSNGHFLVQPGSGPIYNNYGQTEPPVSGLVPPVSGAFVNHSNGFTVQHNVGPQGTNHDQTMPAARLYEPVTQQGENSFLPSTSNPNASSTWQRTQSDHSSTSIPSVTSQSDTNLTISPGESGYDSAEVVHAGDDALRRPSQDQNINTNQSSEMKKSVEDKQSSSTINPNEIGPKNLYRAPVDNKTGSVINNQAAYPVSYPETDLSSAGACATSIHKQSNTLKSLLAANKKNSVENTQNCASKRSLSCDSSVCSQNFSEAEDGKPTVRLRRYSNQESSTEKKDDHQNLSSFHCNLKTNRVTHEQIKKELCNSVTSPQNMKFDGNQKQYTIPKPEMKLFNNLNKTSDAFLQQRRNVPFDTPPVTPRPMDFNIRQTSIDTASENGLLINHKFGDILPTPPHTSDTPASKFIPNDFSSTESHESSRTVGPNNVMPKPEISEHRGYKIQIDGSSPSKTQFAKCNCIAGTDGRTDDAPYYTHLGAAESVFGIRKLFEKRTGYEGAAIRIEKVIYTGKEGKTSSGCPMAKWIIRRSSEDEKVLIVCRQRPGHRCQTAVITVIILLWDGVARPLADFAYSNFTELIPKHGEPTERRCGTNDERTCGCQGFDDATCGASFSFGCSWSMYYNGCKYARSNQPNKYKLNGTKNPEAEKFIGMLFERLATVMSPLYQMAAPDAFHNQVEHEEEGSECRLGERTSKHSRPFSGVTTCFDFCAHSHKDQHNIDNGSTVVVTFTKPELRAIGNKSGNDEQLHVLPLCKLDISNEHGNFDGVAEKIESGAIEILQRYQYEKRVRREPKLSKKQKSRAAKKKASQTTESTDSPPFKRRGRPPKRCKSVENLYNGIDGKSNSDNSQSRERLLGHYKFQTPPRLQQHGSEQYPGQHIAPPLQQQQYPPFPNPKSPTRWPYRRQVIQPHSHGSTPTPQQVSNNQETKTNSQETNTGSNSLLDNLPSIGNFFNPDQPGNDQGPGEGHSNATTPQRPTANENQSTTPLPSIKDVVTHPFRQNFAAVQPPTTPIAHSTTNREPSQDSAPGTPRCGDVSISLKAYAAHNTPHIGHNSPHVTQSTPNGLAIDSSNGRPPQYNYGSYGMQPQMQQTTSEQPFEILYSDSEENFLDSSSEIGGVAVAPGHGSVLIECAKKELHATTALHRPNRYRPSRISMVFYHHKNMNMRNHGAAEYEAKEEERKKLREEKRLEETQKIKEESNVNLSQQLLSGMKNPSISDYISVGQYPAPATSERSIWNPALASHPTVPLPTSRSSSLDMMSPPHHPRFASQAQYSNPPAPAGRYNSLDQTRLKLRAQLIASSPHDRIDSHRPASTQFDSMRGSPVRPHMNMQNHSHMKQFGNAVSPQPARLPHHNPRPQNHERMSLPHQSQGNNWPTNNLIHETNNMKQMYMQHHMGLAAPHYPGHLQHNPQYMAQMNQTYGASGMMVSPNSQMIQGVHLGNIDSKYAMQMQPGINHMTHGSNSMRMLHPNHGHQMYNSGLSSIPNQSNMINPHHPAYMHAMHSQGTLPHAGSAYPPHAMMHMDAPAYRSNPNVMPSSYHPPVTQ